MGFMDTVKGLVGKGKDYAAQNPDKVDSYIDKAGDQVDKRTGGKFSGQVDQAQDAARKFVDTPGEPPGGQRPPTDPDTS